MSSSIPKDLDNAKNTLYIKCDLRPYRSHKLEYNADYQTINHELYKRLTCKTCQIHVNTVSSYYRHLTSNIHTWNSLRRDTAPSKLGNMMLQLPDFLCWDEAVNQRSIVVTSLDCATNSIRLLLHFIKFGLVTDYISDPQGHFAIVQYHDKSCIKNMLQDYKNTKIDGGYVRIRCKDCVSIIEWAILIDLDGIYDQRDQPFFIHHCERMSVLNDQTIHIQLDTFIEDISLTRAGMKIQSNIQAKLCQLFLPIFPNMSFHTMQPKVPDFAEADPILEIFMDPLGHTRNWRTLDYLHARPEHSPPFHHTPQYQAAIARVIHVLGNVPRKESEMRQFASEISAIPDDKFAPFGGEPYDAIFFKEHESGMNCKINFDDPFAPYVALLLELLLEIEPYLLPVLKFVHYWARVNLRQNLSGIKTVLSMMVLVYFMKANVLPSVKALQKLFRYSNNDSMEKTTQRIPYNYVQGWKIGLCTHLPTILHYLEKRGKNLQEQECEHEGIKSPTSIRIKNELMRIKGTRVIFTHLKNFFGAFSWVDFRSFIISPCLGELVPKSVQNFRSANFQYQTAPLIVQHPFDLTRNLASACDEAFVNCMQVEFRNTYRRINVMLQSKRPKISEVFPDFHSVMRYEPRCCSTNNKEAEVWSSVSSPSNSNSTSPSESGEEIEDDDKS